MALAFGGEMCVPSALRRVTFEQAREAGLAAALTALQQCCAWAVERGHELPSGRAASMSVLTLHSGHASGHGRPLKRAIAGMRKASI